jgi:putative membrane protein
MARRASTILAVFLTVTALCSSPAATRAAQPQASVSSADVLFVLDAALSNVMEIQHAQLALQHARNERVRQFAQAMIADRSMALADLISRAEAKGIALPDNLTADLPALPANDVQTSESFDALYMKGQVLAHIRSLNLYRDEARKGTDADIRAYAAATAPEIARNLREARRLLRRVSRAAN